MIKYNSGEIPLSLIYLNIFLNLCGMIKMLTQFQS